MQSSSSEPLYTELYLIAQRLKGIAHLFAAYSEPSGAVERLEEVLHGISSLIEEQSDDIFKVAQAAEDLLPSQSAPEGAIP